MNVPTEPEYYLCGLIVLQGYVIDNTGFVVDF